MTAWVALCFTLVWLAESATRGTRAPISFGYLICALGVAGYAGQVAAPSLAMPSVATIALLAAAPADARTGYLYDAVTMPGAAGVLLLSYLFGRWGQSASVALLIAGLLGGAIYVSRGRLLGMGDLKATFMTAAGFGWIETWLILFFASLSGILFALLHRQCRRGAEIRFGPHLATGAVITLLAGPQIERMLGGA